MTGTGRSIIIVICSFYYSLTLHAQEVWTSILPGTWKVENSNQYEQWHHLNTAEIIGHGYHMDKQLPKATEYLSMTFKKKKVFLTATVPSQNKGNSVLFVAHRQDSILIFKNPKHDFPKRITYHLISATKLRIDIDDMNDKKISYYMDKQIDKL